MYLFSSIFTRWHKIYFSYMILYCGNNLVKKLYYIDTLILSYYYKIWERKVQCNIYNTKLYILYFVLFFCSYTPYMSYFVS